MLSQPSHVICSANQAMSLVVLNQRQTVESVVDGRRETKDK